MTAPTIQLTVEGDTPIQLNSGSILTLQYNQAGPQVVQDAIATDRDRNDLGVPSYQNVTEDMTLLITGASVAAVQASIWSIESALDAARQSRRTWRGVRVFLEIQTAADSAVWRSEILAGTLQLPDAVDRVGRTRVEATLILTRRPYFEGALTQLQLSTAQTGVTTSPVTLYNASDAGTSTIRNWFNIAADQITGDIPAPLKLEIANGETADQFWTQMYLANYVFFDPTAGDPILASGFVGGAAGSWGGDGESIGWRVVLSKPQLADFAGQYCRILAAFDSLSADMWLRVRVDFSVDGTTFSTIYFAPAQVRYQAGQLVDLGCVPLPPFGYNANAANLYVAITGQKAGGWSGTINHIQVCPAGSGLFRRLDIGGDSISIWLEDNDRVVDDGPEDAVYIEDVSDSNANWPIVRPYYKPIYGWPGKVNRVRVLLRTPTSWPEDIVLKARAWVRPRRLSI